MKLALALAFVLAASTAMACGDDDSTDTTIDPTGPPVPTTAPESPTPIPATSVPATPESTGIPEVDQLIDTVEAGDVAQVGDLIELQILACTNELGLGGPPQCGDDEAEGTEVRVFAFSVCEPEWLREEQIAPNLEDAFSYTFRRYAAYESDGAFVIVFEAEEKPVVGAAVAVTLEDGRITKIARICGAGEGGAGLIPEGQTDFLIDPP